MSDNSIIADACMPFAHHIDFFCFKGQPENLDQDNPVQVLVNQGYVVGFSSFRKQPLWAAYRVAAAERDVDYERPHLFYEDIRVPEEDRITTWTYQEVDGQKNER